MVMGGDALGKAGSLGSSPPGLGCARSGGREGGGEGRSPRPRPRGGRGCGTGREAGGRRGRRGERSPERDREGHEAAGWDGRQLFVCDRACGRHRQALWGWGRRYLSTSHKQSPENRRHLNFLPYCLKAKGDNQISEEEAEAA